MSKPENMKTAVQEWLAAVDATYTLYGDPDNVEIPSDTMVASFMLTATMVKSIGEVSKQLTRIADALEENNAN